MSAHTCICPRCRHLEQPARFEFERLPLQVRTYHTLPSQRQWETLLFVFPRWDCPVCGQVYVLICCNECRRDLLAPQTIGEPLDLPFKCDACSRRRILSG